MVHSGTSEKRTTVGTNHFVLYREAVLSSKVVECEHLGPSGDVLYREVISIMSFIGGSTVACIGSGILSIPIITLQVFAHFY